MAYKKVVEKNDKRVVKMVEKNDKRVVKMVEKNDKRVVKIPLLAPESSDVFIMR